MKHVFIHGLGQDSSSWDETISFMKKKIPCFHTHLFDRKRYILLWPIT